MHFRTFSILKLIQFHMPVSSLFFSVMTKSAPSLSPVPPEEQVPLLRTPVGCGHCGLYKTVTPGLLAGRRGQLTSSGQDQRMSSGASEKDFAL